MNREKKRIACFFTGGYTELCSMKVFMRKINADVCYIQLCPTRERNSKNDIQNRGTGGGSNRHSGKIRESGYTGDKLIEHVKDFVSRDKFRREQYDAILIEDDKDERFLKNMPDGTWKADKNTWNAYQNDVRQYVKNLYPDMPVIFILAAPEIEAWFLADWDNGFGKMFEKDLGSKENKYFETSFRKYVNNVILDGYKDTVEEYGSFPEGHRKLSEEIQKGLKGLLEPGFWDMYRHKNIIPELSYSKKIEGADALERIDPCVVQEKCPVFFRDGFYSLQSI